MKEVSCLGISTYAAALVNSEVENISEDSKTSS